MPAPMTLIAHRGYSAKAPENTLLSFLLALAHGCRDIEFDVQLSRDGVPVIIHDDTLERTTNGHGLVREHTLTELQALDAGSWFSDLHAGHRIPTLFELLTHLHGIANLHLELKSDEPELVPKVAQLLAQTGWLDQQPKDEPPRLVISSFDRDQLARSVHLLPAHCTHELLTEFIDDASLQWAVNHKVRSFLPDGKDITPELVARATALGLHVGAWWYTAAEQDAVALAGQGGRYAFVDNLAAHRI